MWLAAGVVANPVSTAYVGASLVSDLVSTTVGAAAATAGAAYGTYKLVRSSIERDRKRMEYSPGGTLPLFAAKFLTPPRGQATSKKRSSPNFTTPLNVGNSTGIGISPTVSPKRGRYQRYAPRPIGYVKRWRASVKRSKRRSTRRRR